MIKRIHISECTDKDVLAEDIRNKDGVFLLPGGTVLNEYIIQRLAEFGIEEISVTGRGENDELSFMSYHIFEKKYENSIREMKHLVLEIIKGKKIGFSTISKITDLVINSLGKTEYVIKCLGEIRDSDNYTYYHCVNVAFYSMLIAGWLNLTRNDIRIVIQGGLLHDLGKAKISNELLNKKDRLSNEEFNEIKKHTVYGYELVRDNPQISEEIKDIILMHHEREDKSGYPLRAGGDHLSIYTKIVAIADVYDAMTSNRPYRSALTPFDAFEELFTICRGRMDMHIVNTLLYNLSRYYTGSKVMLSNGQTGVVAYIPPHCIWKPIVDTGSVFLDLSREKEIYIEGMV